MATCSSADVATVHGFASNCAADPAALPVGTGGAAVVGGSRGGSALRRGLDDSDPETVKNCLWALGRLGDQASAARVIELTRHDDVSVRMMAVYVLGAMQAPAGHVDFDVVATLHQRQRSAGGGLGRHVQHHGAIRGAAHARIRDAHDVGDATAK